MTGKFEVHEHCFIRGDRNPSTNFNPPFRLKDEQTGREGEAVGYSGFGVYAVLWDGDAHTDRVPIAQSGDRYTCHYRAANFSTRGSI